MDAPEPDPDVAETPEPTPEPTPVRVPKWMETVSALSFFAVCVFIMLLGLVIGPLVWTSPSLVYCFVVLVFGWLIAIAGFLGGYVGGWKARQREVNEVVDQALGAIGKPGDGPRR